MLTRPIYNIIKQGFGKLPEELQKEIAAMPAKDQVTAIIEMAKASSTDLILKRISELEAKAFVLLFRLKLQLVKPGSPEHFALRDELGLSVKGWHRENPPVVFKELMDPTRTPAWHEDAQRFGDMVNLLDFAGAHSDEDVCNAIKTVLDIGGMEDTGDPRAIQPTDKTMILFMAGVRYQIPMSRMDWCPNLKLAAKPEELAKEVDLRSQRVIDIEAEALKQEKRNREKREALEASRTKQRADYETFKTAFYQKLATLGEIKTVVDKVNGLDFMAAKTLVKDYNKENGTWLPPEVLKVVAPMAPLPTHATEEQKVELLSKIMDLTGQFILEEVAKTKTGWFRRKVNTDLDFRKAPAKEPGLTRAEMAARGNLARLAKKYGTLEVAKAFLAVYGIQKGIAETFGPLPEAPVTGLEDEADDTEVTQ